MNVSDINEMLQGVELQQLPALGDVVTPGEVWIRAFLLLIEGGHPASYAIKVANEGTDAFNEKFAPRVVSV